MLNSYIELILDVLHAAAGNRYVDGNDIRLINLAPIALFSIYKLTTSSGKHLKKIDHAHIVTLLYKLLPSSKGSEDLSIGFDHDRGKRQRELTNNKNIKGKNNVRICPKDIFGFAEHQEKATYGLGYKLNLTRNTDNAVINKGNAINNAKVKINSIEWYVPHYTSRITQQNILVNQIIKEMATELQYPERSLFMKEVITQNLWTFELGTQDGVDVTIGIYVGFQQNDRQPDQNLTNDTFVRLPVISAQAIIATEKYPDVGLLLDYKDDNYSQGYG